MPEAFKVEVTKERGRDKVEIKEAALMKEIDERASDKTFVDNAVKRLRATVLRLNNKLKQAQGVLGTSIKGLSDKEIKLAAGYVQKKLDKLSGNFAKALKNIKISIVGDTKAEKDVSYDLNKSDLIEEHLTKPLNNYMNGKLDKILAAIDNQDADPAKVAEALNPKPKIRKQTMADRIAYGLRGGNRAER